jgi:hypothetical protein
MNMVKFAMVSKKTTGVYGDHRDRAIPLLLPLPCGGSFAVGSNTQEPAFELKKPAKLD